MSVAAVAGTVRRRFTPVPGPGSNRSVRLSAG